MVNILFVLLIHVLVVVVLFNVGTVALDAGAVFVTVCIRYVFDVCVSVLLAVVEYFVREGARKIRNPPRLELYFFSISSLSLNMRM